jgi:chlorophyllase
VRWSILVVMMVAGCAGEVDDGEPELLDPTQTGPYGVDFVEVEMDLGDRSDGFPSVVTARVHAADLSGAVPVVIFNHGFAVRASQYHDSLNHLASWGFVVVAPQWDSGFPTARSHLGLAEDLVAAIDWLYDNDLPIETIAEPSQLAVMGHSRGGKQALHAAILDDRIVATFTLDPVDSAPPFGSFEVEDFPSVTPELMAGLTVPSGVVGTGYGGQGVNGGQPCAPVEEGYEAYFEEMGAGSTQWVLGTAGHNDFVDDCAEGDGGLACVACPEGDDPGRSRVMGGALAVAWLGTVVAGLEGLDGWVDGTAEGLGGIGVERRD